MGKRKRRYPQPEPEVVIESVDDEGTPQVQQPEEGQKVVVDEVKQI